MDFGVKWSWNCGIEVACDAVDHFFAKWNIIIANLFDEKMIFHDWLVGDYDSPGLSWENACIHMKNF